MHSKCTQNVEGTEKWLPCGGVGKGFILEDEWRRRRNTHGQRAQRMQKHEGQRAVQRSGLQVRGQVGSVAENAGGHSCATRSQTAFCRQWAPPWGVWTGSWRMKKEFIKKDIFLPWLVWLGGLSAILWTKGSLVRFLVRAHTWVMGQVPSAGHTRGNHALMFLSLFLPPFLEK